MKIKVFIQNEKGSSIRSRYNESTLKFIENVDTGVPAEYQYGFIPGTIGEDGDCIDSWLISDRSFRTGFDVTGRVLGILEMYEEYRGECEKDYKVFACPADESTKITQETVEKIKNYTIQIFRKYPEVSISFGRFLSVEKAEEYITHYRLI